MRLLADENIPRVVVDLLRRHICHDRVHVSLSRCGGCSGECAYMD
jgi:hypothetical protein